LESYDVRCDRVEKFVKKLNPNLKVFCFDLKDPVGLAGTIEDIQACILTRESEKGG
jgi:phosphopantetheine adenylyltransferase